MAESLVSWGEAVKLGPVPEIEWLSPGNLEDVQTIARYGGTVTSEDLIILADAQRHQVEAWQYPEGYHAVKIIDAETGNVVNDVGASQEYYGLSSCACGDHLQKPLTHHFTSKRKILLDGGHSLSMRGTEFCAPV